MFCVGSLSFMVSIRIIRNETAAAANLCGATTPANDPRQLQLWLSAVSVWSVVPGGGMKKKGKKNGAKSGKLDRIARAAEWCECRGGGVGGVSD